ARSNVHLRIKSFLVACLVIAFPSANLAHAKPFSGQLPKGIKYREVEVDSVKARQVSREIATQLLSIGLKEEFGFAQALGLDFVAVSADGQKFAIVMIGKEIEPRLLNRLYAVENLFVFHTRVKGQPVALGFRNVNTSEISQFTELFADAR